VTLPFANGQRPLVQYPQKRPLIRLTTRPPQLETPMAVFDEGVITPNDAFFVRYHLTVAPPQSLYLDPDTYKFEVKGKVNTPLIISLNDLKTQFEPVELIAVNQCSGNSRGFFEPRVAGGQVGNGLMGNARWMGVPLKVILDKAGVQAGAKQVSFDGYDGPAMPTTPDFVKALDIDHARDGEVMLAYAMNGTDIPVLNGYPVRLIVPGYYGTYWVKHVSEITVLDHEFDGFWMKTAYRIPANTCACVPPGSPPQSTTPINRFDVRSFITNLSNGAKVKAQMELAAKGIAFMATLRSPFRPMVGARRQVFLPGMASSDQADTRDACAQSASCQPDRSVPANGSFVESLMIKVYGAQIAEQDVNKIAEYLAASY
jgi:sulfite dehydrogenase